MFRHLINLNVIEKWQPHWAVGFMCQPNLYLDNFMYSFNFNVFILIDIQKAGPVDINNDKMYTNWS